MNEGQLQRDRTINIRWAKQNDFIGQIAGYWFYIRSKVTQMSNDISETVCSCEEVSGKAEWTPPQKTIIIQLSTQKTS